MIMINAMSIIESSRNKFRQKNMEIWTDYSDKALLKANNLHRLRKYFQSKKGGGGLGAPPDILRIKHDR